jgi:hypothetical protein
MFLSNSTILQIPRVWEIIFCSEIHIKLTIFPASQEAEIGRIEVQGQPGGKVSENSHLNTETRHSKTHL